MPRPCAMTIETETDTEPQPTRSTFYLACSRQQLLLAKNGTTASDMGTRVHREQKEKLDATSRLEARQKRKPTGATRKKAERETETSSHRPQTGRFLAPHSRRTTGSLFAC